MSLACAGIERKLPRQAGSSEVETFWLNRSKTTSRSTSIGTKLEMMMYSVLSLSLTTEKRCGHRPALLRDQNTCRGGVH